MNLQNFEQLEKSVHTLIDKYRELRFRYYQLQQENNELKEKAKLVEKHNGELNLQEIEKLRAENSALKAERSELKERLKKLIAELEEIDIT
ncbi:cell division protein ZapB [Calditrichota bacterium LG25]